MRAPALFASLVTAALAAAGCSSSEDTVTGAGSTSTASTGTASTGTASTGSSGSGGAGGQGAGGQGGGGGAGGSSDGRPYSVFVPSGYDASTPTPLVLLLHGYTASGNIQELYFQIQPLAEERGFLYVHPDGLKDTAGNQYWNATDACCDIGNSGVDDSAYLRSIIDEVKATYNVDPKRVFLMGHSNGGFMSYRMACDHADAIAAIASLAGATYSDATKCKPTEPVSVLQIHGTLDATIAYDGGTIVTNEYPGAVATVESWATLDGCGLTPDTTSPPLDLEAVLIGNETTVTRYADACEPGGHAELWTIEGGSHIPALSSSFAPSILDFLFAHPKP
jgi:polyhydroxybutyrate depolymerase